ncbi:hypothetical protein SAMN04487783_0968 [Agrococcus baldri]|uniref:DUF4878 domain-containing protein n=1 Tax=Agrococcus baldri TaxID=153730 RepID=A0AA94KZ45_9MICO|nr:hypothetical protein [Agrococcus baldri]SFS07501.1 hypothetical protein SAMN04487783_0968 [Agrococcus baldri]
MPEDVPQEMPQFAMPPAALARPAAHGDDGVPTPDAEHLGGPGDPRSSRHLAEPAAPGRPLGEPTEPPRTEVGGRRFGWRQLAIVGLVCALVGVAIPLSLQSAERTAAAAQTEQLRGLAERYLAAIAAGDAEAASALVPPARSVPVAPNAVLESATRIDQPEVVHALADGDTGVVQVRYRLRTAVISRLLDAQRVDGEWQLTSSLLEQPRLSDFSGVIIPTVAGVELGYPVPLQLYPGWYRLDSIERSIYQSVDEGFAIDGIPTTDTELAASVRLSQTMLDDATARALVYAEACADSGACVWPDTATVRADGAAQWMGDHPTRLLFIQVPLIAQSGSFNEQVVVQVVILLDELGGVMDASCSGLGSQGEEPVACEA